MSLTRFVVYPNWIQQITFGGDNAQNSAIFSTTKDAARIAIQATIYYTYQSHNLPQVGRPGVDAP